MGIMSLTEMLAAAGLAGCLLLFWIGVSLAKLASEGSRANDLYEKDLQEQWLADDEPDLEEKDG